MKKLLLAGVIILTLSHYAVQANPIAEEDFITEIYFEDGQWFLLFNNNAISSWGINSFQEFSIYSNNGPLLINPNVVPDFQQPYTTITVYDLLETVMLSPNAGEIELYYDEYSYNWIIQEFSWGTPPGSAVGPVLPGQSINWLPVVFYENYEVVWMAVKNAEPYYTNGYGDFQGIFTGYLKDHNNNPVIDAEIKYVSDNIMWPNSNYTPLITGEGGYFQKDIYARNYNLSGVVKDGIEYPMDYWLIVEPGTIITMDIVVDMTVGIAEAEKIYHVTLNNHPNPFSDQTTIELKIDDATHFSSGNIRITGMNGSIIAVIPLTRSKFNNNIMHYVWNNTREYNLPDGQYLVTVTMDERQVATKKMIITR
jgi:hypothetical protein